jgi:hypothetical protein
MSFSTVHIRPETIVRPSEKQKQLARAMTKIETSECVDNAENSTCQTIPGYHTLKNSKS